MGCFAPDKPKNLNYADLMRQTLQTQVGLEPLRLSSEAQYSPFQTNLTLQNMNDLLFGSGGGSFDVQTFTPAVYQRGNQLSYGKSPKGFTGDVMTPPLPTYQKGSGFMPAGGMTFDAATGQMIQPRNGSGSNGGDGLGITGSTIGDATLLGGGPFGASIGSAIKTGNPDPISSALGVNFFGGGTPKIKLAGQQYGTRTVNTGPQRGLVDLMNQVNSATRAANVGDISSLGPDAVHALLAADPHAADLINELNRQAMQGLEAGTSLTDEETRLMEQAARASWAARGLGGSDPSAADEVLRQFALGQDLQGRRRSFAAGTVGLDQSYLQNPMLSLLTANGGGAGSQAQSLLPGRMFNPESPYAGNLAAANQQMAAMFADPSTLSKINMVSDTTGKILSNVGSIAGMAGGI